MPIKKNEQPIMAAYFTNHHSEKHTFQFNGVFIYKKTLANYAKSLQI